MDERGIGADGGGSRHGHGGGDGGEWAEVLARTVAHLAAQLTLAQIRLRALATELAERGVVEDAAVLGRVRALAETEAGAYLRENLGEALAELIDVPQLERELLAYLTTE